MAVFDMADAYAGSYVRIVGRVGESAERGCAKRAECVAVAGVIAVFGATGLRVNVVAADVTGKHRS